MSETYIARSQAIASRLLGNEMMVMSVIDSTFFSLNEAATLIWESADGCTELMDIVEQKICPTFQVDPETALHDALQFVHQLSQHDILKVSSRPLNEAASVKIPA
jgi:hypothetical protein